jgi:non-ribosomal peptide synthetase component F
MERGNEAYHIPLGLRLAGDLDHAALRQTLNHILVRHEALRTSFVLVDGEPAQKIASVEGSSFLLLDHDLRQHEDAQQELDRLVVEEAAAGFDMEAGPLVRGRLIRLADDDHVLLVTMHHIVSDGWSMDVLLGELSTLYGAFRESKADPLPKLAIQYADYAVWQRKWIEGEVLQKQAEYWKSALAGAPALLELPTDHPRPAQKSYAGAFAGLILDEHLTTGLRDLSKRHGTTLFMTLLAAWSILLARLSGQQDVVVGTPTANRGHVEIEGLIGFFVNTLAVRVDVSLSPTVGELLAQVKAQAIAAQQHQDIPFEQVVEILRPVRSLAHSPLFQAMFTWGAMSQGRLALPGLELRPLQAAPHVSAKFDMTLYLGEAGDRITGGLEYATSLFEPSTIKRYLGHFRILLEAMVTDDAQRVDRLPILSASERRQVLYAWNDTATEFPSDKCIHELFEEQVAKRSTAIAVVFEEQELSYGELNCPANRLAHHLIELGVTPDSRVALCVERGFEMIVALLAVLKAGGSYVPLDPMMGLARTGPN